MTDETKAREIATRLRATANGLDHVDEESDALDLAQLLDRLADVAAEHGRRRLARYFTRVHASNLHAGYGVPIEVLAATRQEAVSRAIDLGWNGFRRDDARVTIDRIEDLA